MACCSGDLEFVKDMLRADCVRQQLKLRSYVPLREVAEYQNLPHGAELLDAVLLPLHIAALFGHIGIVSLCLDMGIDINATFNLTFDGSVIGTCLDDGVDLAKEANWTALMAAARNGWSNTVMLLLDRGADVLGETTVEKYEVRSETALMMAASKGHFSCLLHLVSWYNRQGLPLDEKEKTSASKQIEGQKSNSNHVVAAWSLTLT
jgi:hypothetical protein